MITGTWKAGKLVLFSDREESQLLKTKRTNSDPKLEKHVSGIYFASCAFTTVGFISQNRFRVFILRIKLTL